MSRAGGRKPSGAAKSVPALDIHAHYFSESYCYDNAAMESWFSTLKNELGEHCDNYGRAKEQLL